MSGIQPIIGKRVAIKVLTKELARDQEMVQRFIREARAVNSIGHPNIIDAFSFGELADGRVYYVMEHLEGRSLADLLKERRLTPTEAKRFLGQCCEALAAAHAEGIVHRDLKPDNIYVANPRHGEPFVKLLDFGIAKLFALEEAMSATRTGMPIGTPYYMSPEQVRGLKSVDHRTDIYAMGVILFEIFAGQVPFTHPTCFEIFYDHMNRPPPRPSTLGSVPAALDDLILRCLAKDPAERPQSAKALGVELTAILEADPPGVMVCLGQPGLAPGRAGEVAPAGGAPSGQVTGPVGVANPASTGAATNLAGPAAAPSPAGGTGTAAAPGTIPPVPRRSPALALGIGAAAVLALGAAGYFGLRGGGGGPDQLADGARTAASVASGPSGTRKAGVVRVATDVGTARFTLDGKPVAQGKTAVLTDVAPGVTHELKVEAEGRPPKVMQVQVAEGGESVVEVTFAEPGPAAPSGPGAPGKAASPRPAPPERKTTAPERKPPPPE
ncbi:MAG TPA: protein kinase, partial [Polyangia bacterium]